MTENQKLREVFEAYITDGGKWPNAILKAPGGQYLLLRTSVAWQDWKACAEALAMPTANHLPDAGKMINGLTQAETDASASVSGLTAAPVGERERFEAWWRTVQMRTFPKEYDIKRLQDWGSAYKPKALEAWQARSALSAGDAVDAQRYRWLMNNCTLGIKQNGVGWSLNTSACVAPDCIKDVGAAIDAAMRKGQI